MQKAIAILAVAAQVVCGLFQRSHGFDAIGNSFGSPGVNASYDYVIIGGGTGGLTIAARLAEDPGVSVAVVEAGGFYQIDNGNGSVIPALAGSQSVGADPTSELPLIDWGFRTTSQPGLGNRSVNYARGKTFGGSSARNYMIYHRATNGTYDKWAQDVGDDSYTWDNLFPYHQRSTTITYPNNFTLPENVTIHHDHDSFNNDLPYHQPLHVSWPKYANAFSTWAMKAFHAVGLRSSSGFDAGKLNGAEWSLLTTTPKESHRDTSQTSFLDYAMRTTDITVYPHTMARKINFKNSTIADSVSVTTDRTNYTITANKEIVLAGGAFHSPQLLMLSGVGPEQTLQQYNIPVVKDLPGVGQNMMDQVFFGVAHAVDLPSLSRLQTNPDLAAAAAHAYKLDGTGPLASLVNAIAFERLVDSAPELLPNSTIADLKQAFPSDWPDVEYLSVNSFSGLANKDIVPDTKHDYAQIDVAMLSPFSRGNVTIASADVFDLPVINPNWLTDPRDKNQAIAAFKRVRKIWSAMDTITIGAEYKPGPQTQSDEEIWQWIQKDTLTIWHASTTCKMGRQDDPQAVVDSKARVYGTERLRVVDASAFPFLPPGHPQSQIYMLAEKIAEDVKMAR